jgi:hypothetical protein
VSGWIGEESKMKARRFSLIAVMISVVGIAQTQPASKQPAKPRTDKERLIGAWHLAHIESPGTDGNATETPQPTGMLLYTRDGHVSVQLMYPKSASGVSNQYVLNGYEASFGSFTIDEAKHTLTHHVIGSNTGDMVVGKDLPRRYRFREDGRLVIRSADLDEHWFVVWEHY